MDMNGYKKILCRPSGRYDTFSYYIGQFVLDLFLHQRGLTPFHYSHLLHLMWGMCRNIELLFAKDTESRGDPDQYLMGHVHRAQRS